MPPLPLLRSGRTSVGMPRTFLKDCAPGDLFDDVLVVANKQISTTNTGKYFIKAFVSDRSIQMTARMWNATKEIFNTLPDAGFLKVRGRVENYQNNLQFIIEQLWPAKAGTFDIGDLLPHTSRDIGKMSGKVVEMCGSIQNRHLAAIVQAYLDDEALMKDFCRAPAAQSFHHAFVGGLLEHTLNAMEIADAVCRFYPGLNRDLVLAGVFLHDIAKTWELQYDCAFSYSDGGQLIGHIVKSAMWIEEKARSAEQMLGERIPRSLIDVLQHIILSHHGTLQTGFGSARNPSTPEALMVHFIDDMDAKMMMVMQACRGDATSAVNAEGNWTEYMKAFGSKFYRPDVAPAEVVESVPLDSSETVRDSVAPVRDAVPTMNLAITNPLFEGMSKKK